MQRSEDFEEVGDFPSLHRFQRLNSSHQALNGLSHPWSISPMEHLTPGPSHPWTISPLDHLKPFFFLLLTTCTQLQQKVWPVLTGSYRKHVLWTSWLSIHVGVTFISASFLHVWCIPGPPHLPQSPNSLPAQWGTKTCRLGMWFSW